MFINEKLNDIVDMKDKWKIIKKIEFNLSSEKTTIRLFITAWGEAFVEMLFSVKRRFFDPFCSQMCQIMADFNVIKLKIIIK